MSLSFLNCVYGTSPLIRLNVLWFVCNLQRPNDSKLIATKFVGQQQLFIVLNFGIVHTKRQADSQIDRDSTRKNVYCWKLIILQGLILV